MVTSASIVRGVPQHLQDTYGFLAPGGTGRRDTASILAIDAGATLAYASHKELMGTQQSRELLPGTLDLLILHTLERGPAHGYAIMDSIWNYSGELFRVEEGALYPALHRLELNGRLASSWGTSEANRRAKYYRLTPAGKKHLARERDGWQRIVLGMQRILEGA